MMRRMSGVPAVAPLVAALLLAVAALHAGLWYLAFRHPRLSGAVASALVALAVMKHAGWLGGAVALLRQRRAVWK